VISQSFSASERSFPNAASILSLRSANERAAANGVTMLSASGDEGVAGENVKGEYFKARSVAWPPRIRSSRASAHPAAPQRRGQHTSPDTGWDEQLGDEVVSGGGGESRVFARPNTSS